MLAGGVVACDSSLAAPWFGGGVARPCVKLHIDSVDGSRLGGLAVIDAATVITVHSDSRGSTASAAEANAKAKSSYDAVVSKVQQRVGVWAGAAFCFAVCVCVCLCA